MSETATLLAVDDGARLADVCAALEESGYVVRTIGELVQVTSSVAPDIRLVLVSAQLRRSSTIAVCIRLRDAVPHVPVIVIDPSGTAVDPAVALEAGADDVLRGPLRPHELHARVRAILRRVPPQAVAPTVAEPAPGDIHLDPNGRHAHIRGAVVALPHKEYQLLRLLLANPSRVIHRLTLVHTVWGRHLRASAKTLDVHIRRLREKVEVDVTRPSRIVTVRGVGFRYEPHGDVIDLRPRLTTPPQLIDLRSSIEV